MKDEKAYIERAKRGSDEAFSYLFNSYYKMTYNFIRTRVGNDIEAEDLTMLSIEKAFKAIPNYIEKSGFKTWLFKIANNSCIDYLRQKRELVDIEDYKWKESLAMNPEQELMSGQGIENIAKSISHLSPIYKNAITLYCFENMTYKEIAQKNNIEVNIVCSRLFQARVRIRKSLNYLS